MGNKAGNRPVRVIYVDSQANPDQAIALSRRLIHAEKVHFLGGPLAGHEGPAVAQVSRGAVRTFTEAGGKVAKLIWVPMGTSDYGPTLGAIPENTDGVSAVIVGSDRIRLFEAWFNFGF